jgi:hypothetical protein
VLIVVVPKRGNRSGVQSQLIVLSRRISDASGNGIDTRADLRLGRRYGGEDHSLALRPQSLRLRGRTSRRNAPFRFGLPFGGIAMLADEFGYLDPSTHFSLAHQAAK